MDMKLAAPILIALSLFYAADSVSYVVLHMPITGLLGADDNLKVTMVLRFVFNLAFAAFVWQVSRPRNP